MPHYIQSKLCVGTEYDHGIYIQYVDGLSVYEHYGHQMVVWNSDLHSREIMHNHK